MSTDIDGYIDELRHTLMVAALNYDIWWVYKSKDTRPGYDKTMRRYWPFFKTSIHAHFVALLVALYGLYETRPDTFNIPSLLCKLRKEKVLSDVTLQSLDQICNEAKPLWKKVCILRNNAFAHRSFKQTIQAVFKKADATPRQLRDLLEVSKRLLNELTDGLGKSTPAFDVDSREATLRSLEDLKYAQEKRKAEEEQ